MSRRRNETAEEASAAITPAERVELDAFTTDIRGRPREEVAETVAALIAETVEAEIAYRASWS